jgi:hypothetical protein
MWNTLPEVKEVNIVNKAMGIEEFYAVLTSGAEKSDSPLLTALRRLRAGKPEDITALVDEPDRPVWTQWTGP